MVEKSSRPHRQGVGACHGFAVPPTDIPGGDPAGPPVLGFASPDRPPSGAFVPHCLRQRLPLLWFSSEGCFEKALAPAPQGQRTARSGGRFAGELADATATAQRAECLLRSTTRGPAWSKAICARHAEGVASGHSLWGCAVPSLLNGHCGRVNRLSGALGVRNYYLHQLRAL